MLLLALAAGCGGGGDADRDRRGDAAPSTPPDVLTVKQPNTAEPGEDPTGDPQFTVTLTGESRDGRPRGARGATPSVRRRSRAARGRGTAKMRVFVDGELVDTLGFFPFDGTLVKTHTWPRSLRGKTAELQAEVEGDGGTQRAVFRVDVR